MEKRIFTLVTALFLSLAFCGPAQSEGYEAVSPSELSFGLSGFRDEAKAAGDETETKEGGARLLNGSFEKFTCEDMEIEVVKKKIKDGIIETKGYGKIRVGIDSSGGLTVYVMPSQKKKLMEKVRE